MLNDRMIEMVARSAVVTNPILAFTQHKLPRLGWKMPSFGAADVKKLKSPRK
jgi:hypothetical protein